MDSLKIAFAIFLALSNKTPAASGLTQEAIMEKRLYRSNNKKLAGVCAGIAEYFDIDPTLVRVLWVLFILAGGSGILAYIICAFVIPSKAEVTAAEANGEAAEKTAGDGSWKAEKDSAEETEATTTE